MYTPINAIPTSQEMHYISTTEINRLMLFGEIISDCLEKHTKNQKYSYALCTEYRILLC
jgi:hypothetical protein